MPSQNDFRIMQLLRPVWLLTKQPSDDALAIYCEKLSKFSLDAIKQAVEKISNTWEKPSIPPLPVFLQTCEMYARGVVVSAGTTGRNEIEERQKARADLLTDFRNNFLKSDIYRRADLEGWDSKLYRYTIAVAWVQIQIILPGKSGGIGWDGSVIPVGEKIKEFIEQQRQLISGNMLNVQIPNEMIDSWKAFVELEKEYYQPKNQVRA